jgi:hypothetical protein
VISHEYGKDRIVITTNGTYHVVMCDTDSVRRSGLSPQVYLSNETKSGERLKFDHCIVHDSVIYLQWIFVWQLRVSFGINDLQESRTFASMREMGMKRLINDSLAFIFGMHTQKT